MKRILPILLSLALSLPLPAQENVPEAARKRGYGIVKTEFAQLDQDPASEQVFLFGHDNGHWPEFDLFKSYIAVVDSHTREVEFLSD